MSAATGASSWAGLDALPDAVVVVDAAGRVGYANAAAVRLVGDGAAGDLVGADAVERLPLMDAAGRDWWVCTRPLATDPTVAARIPETELTLFPDGAARPVSLTGARHGRGSDALLVLCLRRTAMRRRREERHAELVSALSHDLRSPLTTVKGFAKTLLARDDRLTREQRQEMLAAVVADADRLNRLIGEVVDGLRLHADRLELRVAPVDLRVLADRALAALSDDRRGRVRDASSASRAPVRVDADRVVAVLATMLDTALTGEGVVEMTSAPDGAWVHLSIAAPAAVPPVPPPELFARDLATDRDAIRRWVARGVAEAHGGRLQAASSPDGGLALTLVLPLDVQGPPP